ncbi:DOWNSTREAM NEIGHBOR OF SON [Salix viminalis]|uniref:DOWNSTREAM NEIGHBOR OF SON n=1 Tax=Salix viminalis TaxID=40686 RepID=A0A9Q0V7H7_SALVM|nr:DOWNSTREAM NEIGHBOR OF SON [Salix viminalis]
MAKVAAPSGLVGSVTVQIGGGGGGGASLTDGPMVRRKTPSELRGEQLKRTKVLEIVDEPPAPLGSKNNSTLLDNGPRKPDTSRTPRYIDTRLDEVYPAKKSRLRMLSVKDSAKENASTELPISLKNITKLSTLVAKRQQLSCPENSVASDEVFERCGEKSSGLAFVDMDKALKGLVAHEAPYTSGLNAASEKSGNHSGDFCFECNIAGQKAPLDFTLKTRMRVASSCSVNRIHRSIMSSTYNGMPQLASQFGDSQDNRSSRQALTSQILSSKALHSWVYPQSTLPAAVISVLASSATEGDFIRKRQLAWEDSFRSLYYMLRKNICNIFYVRTSQFVVMFTGSDGLGRTTHLCNAYISQSTRGLRSLLREHDVCFSMPLCHSKVEQVTTEDLVELSEIEKQNLGQTRRLSSLSDVDNSPQSLLAFCGNKNVHGLYDFLLNYRSSLPFLSGVDVPVLYSAVPFQNAALSAPEIKCVEVKRADHNAASPKGSQGSSTGLLSSIEIKDACIPSWIVCRVCALMGSEGRSFEASFTTDRTSIGLNVALETAGEKPDQAAAAEGLQESSHAFGIPEATVAPCLSSGFLKGLKYCDGSYTASLSPA